MVIPDDFATICKALFISLQGERSRGFRSFAQTNGLIEFTGSGFICRRSLFFIIQPHLDKK